MPDEPQWTHEDGWILMSLFLAQGENGAPLHEIIKAADVINHAIPTADELSQALTKFARCELATVDEDRYVLATDFLPKIKKAYDGKGGLFMSSEKGHKWLMRSGLVIKNDLQIELTQGQTQVAYEQYIQSVRKN